ISSTIKSPARTGWSPCASRGISLSCIRTTSWANRSLKATTLWGSLVAWGNVVRWWGCARSKEIVVHLLDEELLRFLCSEVEPVFVHDHLHMLHPTFPRLFGNVVIDLLT